MHPQGFFYFILLSYVDYTILSFFIVLKYRIQRKFALTLFELCHVISFRLMFVTFHGEIADSGKSSLQILNLVDTREL